MAIVIRRADSDDALAIRHLHEAAIRAQAPQCYDAAQVDAWAAPRPIEKLMSEIEEKTYLVALESERIVGFGAIEAAAGDLIAVYVAPDHMGCGIGRKLLIALEEESAAAHAPRVRCHASLNALGFYKRCRYRAKEPTAHRFADGTDIPCMIAEKQLGDDNPAPSPGSR